MIKTQQRVTPEAENQRLKSLAKVKQQCFKCNSSKSYTNPMCRCFQCHKKFCYSHIICGQICKGMKDNEEVKDVCLDCKKKFGYKSI